MSHMRCEKHSRRVVEVGKLSGKKVLPGETVFHHRNGDGSKCDSEIIICGTRLWARHPMWHPLDETPREASLMEMVAVINRIADREAERILKAKGII